MEILGASVEMSLQELQVRRSKVGLIWWFLIRAELCSGSFYHTYILRVNGGTKGLVEYYWIDLEVGTGSRF